jgi:branched-chain amino acid transport system permease protein
LIFAIAVLGCNLLLGYTGLMSFGQGIFFGVGAYASSWIGAHGGGLASMLLGGGVAGMIAAVLVGFFSIRQRGVYFVMLTLAFAQLFYFLAYSLRDLTGGENGIFDVPRPALHLPLAGTVSLASASAFYVFCALLFLLAFFAVRRVAQSPFGMALVAIRENETRALAVGFDVRRFKLAAFTISGLVTGVAGGVYAPFLHVATLSNIDMNMSQAILIMTIIGGSGTLAGALAGALFYVVMSTWLATFWPRWPMLIGLLLAGISLYCPGGIWGACRAALDAVRDGRKKGASHDAAG